MRKTIDIQPATWFESDGDDNAESTATHAAETDNAHFVTGVSASYDAAAIGLLQIKDGTTVIYEIEVHNAQDVEFVHPLQISRGAACSAVLAASGTGGVTSQVWLRGFTE